MKTLLSTILLAGLFFALGGSIAAQQKKIGMARAQAIASEHARGLRLKAKELEKEKGQWIYSFEFLNKDGSIREVNVNAYSGKVVVEHETAKKDAEEERNEKKGKN